jgi:cysteine desulfurase/selenocysteine lyase
MHNYRQDFPLLHGDKSLVYLDSAASAQKPNSVILAMQEMMQKKYANVHRGLYPLSEEATLIYEGAREKVREYLNARSQKEIIFTKNATEAINLVARAWGEEQICENDAIITFETEHHSNYLPWLMLVKKKNARLITVPIVRSTGEIDWDSLCRSVQENKAKIKLFAVSHVSNVSGLANPISKIVGMAREVGAKVLVDGCQAVAHMPINVLDLDVDFYVFSGHKLYGPTGIGVLYAKRDILEYMPPFLYGGEMVLQVSPNAEEVIWKELPWKFESGTPSIVEAVGLAAAIEYVRQIGWNVIIEKEAKLKTYFEMRIKELGWVRMVGEGAMSKKIAVYSMLTEKIHPHDLAHYLGQKGICVRAGNHCNQLLHSAIRADASLRVSMAIYSEESEIDQFIEGMREAFLRLG